MPTRTLRSQNINIGNASSTPIQSLSENSDRVGPSNAAIFEKQTTSVSLTPLLRPQANPPTQSTPTVLSAPESMPLPQRRPRAGRNSKIPQSGKLKE